jgi:hypothetical protein
MAARLPQRPKVAFGPDQTVERIEKHEGRLSPTVGRQFAFKLPPGCGNSDLRRRHPYGEDHPLRM